MIRECLICGGDGPGLDDDSGICEMCAEQMFSIITGQSRLLVHDTSFVEFS